MRQFAVGMLALAANETEAPGRRTGAYTTLIRRFLWLNIKHSVGFWLFPLFLLLAWYASQQRIASGITLWVYTSASIGLAAILIAPVAAGATAWLAVQGHRQRVNALLDLAPDSRFPHDLGVIAGVTCWAGLAYVLNGCFQFVVAIRGATWGTLDLRPVWVGLLTILAATTVGYLFGTYIPSRLTAPAMAIVLFIALVGLYGRFYPASSIRYLSPYSFLVLTEQGVIFRFWPTVVLPLTTWLLGLSGVALAATALRHRWSYRMATLLLVAVIATGSGAGLLLQQPPRTDRMQRQRIPYEPVCMRQVIEVCVHPAYRAVLAQTAAIAEGVFRPVAGLSGVPSRIEQYAALRDNAAPGTVDLPIYFPSNGADYLAQTYALFVVDGKSPGSPKYPNLSPAQCVIGRWLVRQAGLNPTAGGNIFMSRSGVDPRTAGSYEAFDATLNTAAERFGRLSPAEQRAWLERNLEPVREGKLALADLP